MVLYNVAAPGGDLLWHQRHTLGESSINILCRFECFHLLFGASGCDVLHRFGLRVWFIPMAPYRDEVSPAWPQTFWVRDSLIPHLRNHGQRDTPCSNRSQTRVWNFGLYQAHLRACPPFRGWSSPVDN